MIVLVTGGRDYSDRGAVYRALDELHRQSKHNCMRVVQGGARGADRLAWEWCHSRYVMCVNVPADWERYGKRAGIVRNAEMLRDNHPDIVLAFPGGRGTADMVLRAQRAGYKVVFPANTGEGQEKLL